jgi:hypothetical protein
VNPELYAPKCVTWVSALASADVLLTLDRADFSRLLGGRFYGLAIMTPGMWLSREREAGRLKIV